MADDPVSKEIPVNAPAPRPPDPPTTLAATVNQPYKTNFMNYGSAPLMSWGMNFEDIGSSGLRAFAGYVREEFLLQLQGRQGAQKYREMMDNSAIVGAIIFAVQATMRKVEWRVEPADDSGEAAEMADFADSLRDDMSHTWSDLISENLSMLGYGYAPHEIVYKRRLGRRPGADPRNPGKSLPSSAYDDGLIGFRRIPIRGQDTILKWFFDNNGQVTGLTQQPWVGPIVDVPIEKLLLFRPSAHKNNPEGRALDPETMIPTPDGWRKLDDLAEGSKVFDDRGSIRYVTARADWEARPCYRLTFGDGSEIIADANHQWITQNQYERNHRKEARLRTTAEIAETLRTPSGVTNHAIAWAGALDYPEQALIFDPYLLGMWLGDGNSNGAVISCHANDLEETVALVGNAGYRVETQPNGVPGGNGRSLRFFGTERWAHDGPVYALRAIGVLNNKHIPQAYLRGSIAQRMALLSGLMDSDGHVDNCGRCEFSNTNSGLASGVAELVRSLGIGAALTTKKNSSGNTAWLVKFTPTWTPFRLSRKAARCRTERQRMNHYIVGAEAIPPRRTVCIEVDSPSHLFLAGENMVPTHNSILRNSYRAYYFIKRIEEQEAILFERLNGIPVIKIPAELLASAQAGDANAIATVNAYKAMARNVRIDEQMGIVIPSDTYDGTNGPSPVPKYAFELATPQSGARGVKADETIRRYQTDILTSCMSDFLTLGHNSSGTQALAVSKVDMFFQAIEGYLGSVASIYNRYGLPRIWDLNGLDPDLMPKYEPDLASRVDLDVLSNFVLRLSQAGMPMFPDDDLQTMLRDAAGMPDITDPAAMAALETEQQQAEAVLENTKNPPEPAKSPLAKIILASFARRMIRKSGNRFSIDSVSKTKRLKRYTRVASK